MWWHSCGSLRSIGRWGAISRTCGCRSAVRRVFTLRDLAHQRVRLCFWRPHRLVWYHGAVRESEAGPRNGFCVASPTWSTATFEILPADRGAPLRVSGLYVGGGLVLALAAASVGIALAGML